jgi:hypothetical protein
MRFVSRFVLVVYPRPQPWLRQEVAILPHALPTWSPRWLNVSFDCQLIVKSQLYAYNCHIQKGAKRMKYLKTAALWVMATIGLLLALAGVLIAYYMIHPTPLHSTLVSLLLVIGLASFFLAMAEVRLDCPSAEIPEQG